MKQLILLTSMIASLAQPATAGLFSAKGDTVAEKQQTVRKQSEEILAKLYATHPDAKQKIENAVGYGAFNNKNLNLFLLSSGHGYGMVKDKSGKETFMAMGSLGGGIGLGAKDLSVVFIFKNADVMKKFRVRVAVTFSDGQRIEVDRGASRGIQSPLPAAEVSAKYRTLTDGLIDASRQRAIEVMTLGIEDVADVRELLALLAPPVGAAFE